ncbi:unnamed protein product [Mytilus coruscus]|uniref:Endonuclease/exonuclease/phosphatase domain-containing protein n=1 Tax=Mytilus coruscus TaxID=42192 RepID=A0A6J8BIZ8_MYTCO|nr:unnamed protein product [Mytilus coruscus]
MIVTFLIVLRVFLDTIANRFGKLLIQLCYNTGLTICNGRLGNDRDGKFTLCSPNSRSLIDYMSASPNDYDKISNFGILNINEFSDHSPLVFEVGIKTVTKENLPKVSSFIKWEKDKVEEYKTKLNLHKNVMTEIVVNLQQVGDANSVVKSLTDIIYNCAFEVFGSSILTHEKEINQAVKHNEWFNQKCKSEKAQFNSVRNTFLRNGNEANKQLYIQARTKYNKTKRSAKFQYKKSKEKSCEDTKLRGKVGSLSLQFNLTKDSLQNNIKTVRHDLKEIRRSTGRSQDGIPVIRSASHKCSISESFPTPSVPQIILEQIIHSDYGRHLNFSSSGTEKKKKSSKKLRAITGTVRSYNELESILRAARRRKIKSEGGLTKQLLSIDQLPIDVNQVDCSSELATPILEDDVFDDSNIIVSGSSPTLQCVEHSKNAETHTNNQNQVLTSKNCSTETEQKPKESTNNLSVFHSPWKVHNRSGKKIDPLEIPHIKDCYRPMCRQNCSTCLSRKKKTPCFLVPGINISHDHFNIEEKVEDDNEGKSKRKTSKNKNKIYENAATVESTIDNDDIVAQCSNTENYLSDLNISNEKEKKQISEGVASFVAECLEIRRNTTRKVISKARITELSKPKDGGRKDVMFSKTFIKKELEKMKKLDPISQLTSEERRRLHRVQGQIALFLAVLNQKRASLVKPMNEVLDDFPVRDDFHHQHEPVALPTLEMPGNRRARRKVWFQ